MRAFGGLLLLLLGALGCDAEDGLRAGPSNGGQAQSGTCAELTSDCGSRCQGRFQNAVCMGELTGSFDNVTVPAGQNCRLAGATVTGNLEVEDGASVDLGPGTFVCGNVEAEKASQVQATGLRVCGNLQSAEVASLRLEEAVEVLKNLQVAKTAQVTLAATLVCADAQFSESSRVQVPAGAASIVVKNCSAEQLPSFDFQGLQVVGENSGCVGAQ